VWAATNKARVEQLTAEGLMTTTGQAAIEQAKADGSWDKLATSDSLHIPPELARAFRSHPRSKANFDAFPPGVRKQLIFWVDGAKKDETRARRSEEIARQAQQNVRANQWTPTS
jgi:uncharacterized protein YdeI (YjbR/CyaY-like superfamily)